MAESKDERLPDLRYVRELAKVFKQYGLDEIEIETGDQRVLLRRGDGAPTVVQAAPAAPQVAATEAVVASAPSAEPEVDEGDFITSPFVGIFYSSPKPDSDSFVTIGKPVAAGVTVCIVEAMKLFNEIEAEEACVIEEVLVNDGDPVEFGSRLFRVSRK